MDSTSDKSFLINKEEEMKEESTSQTSLINQQSTKDKKPSKGTKRKRITNVNEDELKVNPIAEIFLKIIYPLTIGLDKSIVVGVLKSTDFNPGVLLFNNGKNVLFSEQGWNSFNKNMNLVQCYLLNKVYGKKTSIRLNDSNVEIDNVKVRNSQGVRFRDLTSYESKVVLDAKEFSLMLAVTPAINRYLEQLQFCGPVIKDYLTDAICKQPNMHLIYGPIDTSIYNRLPQEVDLYRSLLNITNDSEKECEEDEDVVKIEDEEEENEKAIDNV